MAIMRWDPFGEALKMQRDMDRIFSRLGTSQGAGATTTAWMPRINVKRSGDDLAVNVELAGIKPEDVSIEVTDGVLTIKGERKGETQREDEGWMIRESSFGSFERAMALPDGVDPASIKADFHDGMLEIHVPKALEAARPKSTKIEIGGAATETKSMEAGSSESTETKPMEAGTKSGEAPTASPQEPMSGQPGTQIHH